jgi:AcrR family transcriptional regulator
MPKPPMMDRRVAKTRFALRDAMLALLPKQSWDDLSIQDICNQANVGRSTFYIHYHSKDELLSENLNDLRDSLSAAASPSAAQTLGSLHGLLAHMVQQKQVFKSVVGRRSGQAIERRFREMVCQLMERDLIPIKMPLQQRQMLARYLAGGIVDLMAWWVDNPKAPSVDALEQLIQELAAAALHKRTPNKA